MCQDAPYTVQYVRSFVRTTQTSTFHALKGERKRGENAHTRTHVESGGEKKRKRGESFEIFTPDRKFLSSTHCSKTEGEGETSPPSSGENTSAGELDCTRRRSS